LHGGCLLLSSSITVLLAFIVYAFSGKALEGGFTLLLPAKIICYSYNPVWVWYLCYQHEPEAKQG